MIGALKGHLARIDETYGYLWFMVHEIVVIYPKRYNKKRMQNVLGVITPFSIVSNVVIAFGGSTATLSLTSVILMSINKASHNSIPYFDLCSQSTPQTPSSTTLILF